ncbi:iron-containing alcohol dehydrogenase [Pontibacterium granulatum]|uniref:iron-containing alcohol dehydrogenase n=1 Tax=Pontibacterium granulatum TaxID=2036029 RepID=UPI00249B1EAF|nr:iron-containing alcohol dehydrogenase [Pontibacterium granulatum]MDI3325589.1 iron-containing alcohol dehydrogenase [Pontibacterium granulatum]
MTNHSADLNADWHYPTSIRNGAGRIKELPDACKNLNIQAPLLVTDPGLAALPMIKQAVKHCQASGLRCNLFCDIQGNPTGQNVVDGVTAYKAGNHDGVIAFGGGSSLDTGKAIALMAGQKRPLWDFEDIGDNWTRADPTAIAPTIAIPTTAGTGSEVGRAAVITDEANLVKRIIFHPKMLPSIVILDAELTVDLPPHITAATGMDALSHCLEAYCAPGYHPMADGIALEGMRLVKENLPRGYANGQDRDARSQMLVASSMGATAFQKGLGGMHAIAHTLGALYGAHHGLLNAILMPYVLQANQAAIQPRIERLSRYLDLPTRGFDGFMDWVLEMRNTLGIPHSLADIAIDERQAVRVGQMAAADPSAGGNPIAFSAERYSEIFRDAVKGELNQ